MTSPITNPSGVAPATTMPGWAPKFIDDFNGSALDPANYLTYNGTKSEDRGPKSKDLLIVHGGMLSLRVAQLDGVWTGSGCSLKPATTGVYGRYQIRSRYANGAHAKAVALTWPVDGWPPEIDFIEYDAGDGFHSKVFFTNHYDVTDPTSKAVTAHNQMQHASLAVDPTQWHTYEMTWLPDGIRYRVDGLLVATQSGHVPATPMWLGLSNNLDRNAAADGSYFRPDPTLTPVIDWDIDWLAVWTPSPQRLQAAYDAVTKK